MCEAPSNGGGCDRKAVGQRARLEVTKSKFQVSALTCWINIVCWRSIAGEWVSRAFHRYEINGLVLMKMVSVPRLGLNYVWL